MRNFLPVAVLAWAALSLSNPGWAEPVIVHSSELIWEQLNPARGDMSPKATTVWGDRKGRGATGFLVKFVDGFSSPPHIHNVSYRGVVMSGLVHNADPAAAKMWMPAGSFWSQPLGQLHITAAKGDNNVAYIEIEDGPYLVMPPKKAFETRERPVNVDPSNLVWLNGASCNWLTGSSACLSFLWGQPKPNSFHGTLLKLPAGFKGKIDCRGSTFLAVVIQGTPRAAGSELDSGSLIRSPGESSFEVDSEEESILYTRSDGPYQVSDR